MDDNKANSIGQVADGSQGIPGQSTPAVQPADQTQSQPSVQQSQAPTPVSAPMKEQAPIPSAAPQEVLQASTPELILQPEVAAAGVEVKPEIPSVSPDAQKAGLMHAKDAVPLPNGSAPLDLSTPKPQVFSILQVHKKVTESIRWLAMLVLRQMKMQETKKEIV